MVEVTFHRDEPGSVIVCVDGKPVGHIRQLHDIWEYCASEPHRPYVWANTCAKCKLLLRLRLEREAKRG